MRARFRKFLKTRDGAFALGIVLACGLALSFFTWRTFVDPLPGQYRLDFGNARWIEPATPSPCGYFRKTLYISGSVEHAWIEFSATDHVYVFVNGVFVNETNFSCARVSGIFDIKHLLTTGKNVIAVYVPRVFQPGSSQILVRGFYATDTSPLTEFRTDATWKASTTPDRIIGGYKWNDPMLDDALWANARETTPGERFPTVQTVSVDPRIFQRRPSANWLGPRLVGAQDATFETSVRAANRRDRRLRCGHQRQTRGLARRAAAHDTAVRDPVVIRPGKRFDSRFANRDTTGAHRRRPAVAACRGNGDGRTDVDGLRHHALDACRRQFDPDSCSQ